MSNLSRIFNLIFYIAAATRTLDSQDAQSNLLYNSRHDRINKHTKSKPDTFFVLNLLAEVRHLIYNYVHCDHSVCFNAYNDDHFRQPITSAWIATSSRMHKKYNYPISNHKDQRLPLQWLEGGPATGRQNVLVHINNHHDFRWADLDTYLHLQILRTCAKVLKLI